MQSQDFEMSILVGNKPITQYPHEGSIYVEGRKGSEYTIRLRNKSTNRVCFILSVDGLSVLDGKEAGNDSPGYVLSPWEMLDVACYKVDDQTGAKFEFGSKGKSYSAKTDHGTANVGVIAAMVFREKVIHHHIHHHSSPQTRYGGGGWYGSWDAGRFGVGSAGSFSAGSYDALGSGSLQSANDTGGILRSMNSATSASTGALRKTASKAKSVVAHHETDFEQQALGTSFGDAMEWKTKTVTFEREAAASASLVIFYDSKKNLELRGIEFKKKVPPLPNPFPANAGCPVPSGWRNKKR